MEIELAERPAILLVTYGLVAGGGETFPIFLANGLRRRGWPVAVLNFVGEDSLPGIRALLSTSVPLYHLVSDTDFLPLCEAIGIDIVHTCQTSTDAMVARQLGRLPEKRRLKHVVTLHGGYEVLSTTELMSQLSNLAAVDHFTYVATKNLSSLPRRFQDDRPFTRIPNAVPDVQPGVVHDRCELGIAATSSIVMLVSRAIPSKGWDVAIQAVEIARASSGEDIQLVLVGNGPIYDELTERVQPDWLHLLGLRGDVRAWMAIADLGLLPTTFAGESFPLVLIDFLSMGVPVIATNVGEIAEMMTSESGVVAGSLIEVESTEGLSAEVARRIVWFNGLEGQQREELAESAKGAAMKFDFENMVSSYEEVYLEVFAESSVAGFKTESF